MPSHRRCLAPTPNPPSYPKRLRSRVALGLVVGFAGCTVYDQALIDSATGSGGRGSGATGGGTPAGQGGSLGGSGGVSVTGGKGGASGGSGGASGGSGGAGPTGGTGATEGGSDGEGGEGDQGAGGSSGVGQGGTGGGGAGGATGGTGGAGSGGVGGTSGAGAGGTGGTSGAGTGGTSGAGTGGTGGAGAGGAGAGAGGAGPEVCSGCARLSVPLNDANDRAHFCVTLEEETDLSAAIITFRVARFAGTGGSFRGYIQHDGSPDWVFLEGADTPFSSIGTTPGDIVWDLSTVTTTFDKTIIARIGIQVTASGATAWTNPTVLYVDSISVTGADPAIAGWTFDTSATVHTTPVTFLAPGPMWHNNHTDDTTAVGSAISWLGP